VRGKVPSSLMKNLKGIPASLASVPSTDTLAVPPFGARSQTLAAPLESMG
jgi:hypothetical protein